MVNLPMRYLCRCMVSTVLIFTLTVMASDAPPVTLPRGFLEQLPLLMQLSDKEFELFLKYTGESKSYNRRTGERTVKSGKGNKGEHDEN